MPVLDWSLSRKKSNFYKIVDVINMSGEDSFASVPQRSAVPERPAHNALRRIKSLNDLLNDDDDDNQPARSGSGSINITKQSDVSTAAKLQSANQTEHWSDELTQRGAKKPTGKFIVSGFSTLSRRAGGGMRAIAILFIAS